MSKKDKYFIQDGMISRFDFMNNQEFYPLTTLCHMLNDNDEKYDKLAKKFVIVSKALELACDFNASTACGGNCEYCRFQDICIEVGLDANFVNYFINKAKEMVENE